MNIWQTEPGEMLLGRAPVTFATGAAMRVRGMRWFRDTERNDIQNELPGWPEGPSFTARSTGSTVGLKTLKDLPTLREIKELTELEDEVEVPEELRAFEEERRKQIEAEQDGLLEDDEEYERMAAEREGADDETGDETGEDSEDAEEVSDSDDEGSDNPRAVSFQALSGGEDDEEDSVEEEEDSREEE